tara:strand:- start:1161 stop:2282 length:1122 start_codon:yes stop_codon:yes gene_type:complete
MKKKILFNNLSFKIKKNKKKLIDGFSKNLKSNYFVLGPQVQKFEKKFAQYLGAKYCIGVANGSDALEIALKISGIKYGDKVATSANAGMYSTNAILSINATPVFLDVDINTKNLTYSEIIKCAKKNIKAIIVTHLYGLAIREIKKIASFCKKKRIILIEDCAQAHGAIVNNKKVGTFGNISTFSFYPTKNLGAVGDGGAIVTNNKNLAEKAYSFRQYGWNDKGKLKYFVKYSGGKNSRLDEIQATILLELLPQLDEMNKMRRKVALKYNRLINHQKVIKPIEKIDKDYVNYLYVIRCKKRDQFKKYLKKFNILTEIHYPLPDYRQINLRKAYKKLYLRNTEKLCKEVLTLPCYYGMNDKLLKKISIIINKWPA